MTYWHLLWMFVTALGIMASGLAVPILWSWAREGGERAAQRHFEAYQAQVPAMSRWRRQQRKRALRRRLADREQLFSQISAGIADYVNRRLKEPVGVPSLYAGYATAWLERLAPRPNFRRQGANWLERQDSGGRRDRAQPITDAGRSALGSRWQVGLSRDRFGERAET